MHSSGIIPAMSIEDGTNPALESNETFVRNWRRLKVYSSIFALNEDRSNYLHETREQMALDAYSDNLEGITGVEFGRVLERGIRQIGSYIGTMSYWLRSYSGDRQDTPKFIQGVIDDARTTVKSQNGYPERITESDIAKIAHRQISFNELLVFYDRPKIK